MENMSRKKFLGEKLKDIKRDLELSTSKEKILGGTLTAILALAIGILFYNSLVVSAALLLTFPVVLHVSRDALLEKKHREYENQFKDFLYSLSASLEGVKSFPLSVREGAKKLEKNYPKNLKMAREMKAMISDLESHSTTSGDFFRKIGEDFKIEEALGMAIIFDICTKSGGDIIKSTSKSTKMLAERITIEGQIRATIWQKKLEGFLMVAMPFAIIGVMRFSVSGYFDPVYEGIGGRLIMTFAIASMVIALRIIKKITDFEI